MAKRRAEPATDALPRSEDAERSASLRRHLQNARRRLRIQSDELRAAHEVLRLQAAQLDVFQESLEKAQSRAAGLFEFAPVYHCVLDHYGIVLELNLAVAALFDVKRFYVEGYPFRRFVAPEDRDRIFDHMRRCRRERGPIVSRMKVVAARGAIVPVQLVSWRTPDGDRSTESFPTLITDVTDQQRASEARDALLRRLTEAQEVERTRLSRELHDQMGQHVVALMLGLRALETRLAGRPEADPIGPLFKIADDIGQEAHRLASNLRPTSLDDLGLHAALANLTREWSLRAGIQAECHFTPTADSRLPRELETTLYRCVQEALNNVARHACASRASVVVTADAAFASLIVEDDGRGFDVNGVLEGGPGNGRLGLLGLRERIELVQGRLEIESSPGAGTSLFVRVPIPAGAARSTDGTNSTDRAISVDGAYL